MYRRMLFNLDEHTALHRLFLLASEKLYTVLSLQNLARDNTQISSSRATLETFRFLTVDTQDWVQY